MNAPPAHDRTAKTAHAATKGFPAAAALFLFAMFCFISMDGVA